MTQGPEQPTPAGTPAGPPPSPSPSDPRPPSRRRWAVDLTPLRTSRDFRLLFASGLVTYLGSMITYVAVPYQVATLTGSFVAVGLLGVVELVPLIVFGLWGGAIADAVDRRRLVLLTECVFMLLSTALLANALLPEPALWPLYVLTAVMAAVDGLQRPSLDAILPRVVAHDELPAAGALSSMKGTVGSIAGPAIGGLLLATAGVWAAYAADVATFAVSVMLLWAVHPVPPSKQAEPPSMRRIREGMAYAWSRKDVLGTYLVDLAAMFFAFPFALFPFIAQQFGAPWSLGLLYSAEAVGALVATATSGWTGRIHRHGRAVVLAAMVWGAAIALVGLAPTIWFVLAALVVAGGADMVSGLFRMLIWNQTVPDHLRGRMAGIELLSYSIGPQLGQIRASGVAQLTSLRASLVSGGVACVVACGLLAAALPALWGFDARTDEHAVRERDARAGRAPRAPAE